VFYPQIINEKSTARNAETRFNDAHSKLIIK